HQRVSNSHLYSSETLSFPRIYNVFVTVGKKKAAIKPLLWDSWKSYKPAWGSFRVVAKHA
ncbi:TPA: hypothetical protein ACYRWH_004408, partial [Enterobacter hormaechei]